MEREAVIKLKKALDDKFALDITILGIGQISTMADYFVIATAANTPQMSALTETAEEVLTKCGFHLSHIEGMSSAKWVLLDFGSIIVHLFDKESREFYNLERVWRDADKNLVK